MSIWLMTIMNLGIIRADLEIRDEMYKLPDGIPFEERWMRAAMRLNGEAIWLSIQPIVKDNLKQLV